MAVSRATLLPVAQLEAILAAPKHARNVSPLWREHRAPDNALIAATLGFTVDCLGHELFVEAIWKNAHEQQVFMHFKGDGGNLARLCVTAIHQCQPHWHHLECIYKRPKQTTPVTNLPVTHPVVVDSLLDYFIDIQQITGIIRQGFLLP